MDRKIISSSKGFTLIELLVVIAILGILGIAVITSKSHTEAVNSVNQDLHAISSFLKSLRLQAFTTKTAITVTVATSTTITSTTGATLNLENDVLATGSPFTISTRGNFTNGNIRLDFGGANPPPTGTRYTCVAIDNVRIRLGEINGATCDAI